MKFNKFGKAYHIVIEKPEDLRDVLAIDDSFWAATSAPTTGFHEDKQFLAYLDSDSNGRIRSDEVRASLRWFLDRLVDISSVGSAEDRVATKAIDDQTDAGKAIHVTVDYVNEQAGRNDGFIHLEDVRAAMAALRAKPLNGDGILVSAASNDTDLTEYIDAAISATGGSPDISGATGVSSAQLDAFHAAIGDFLTWKAQGAPDNLATMPLGADTPAVHALCAKHAAAIDRFFFLSRFLRYDPANAEKYLLANPAAATEADALDEAPLARPTADGALPLDGDLVNPLRRADVEALRDGLFGRVLGSAAPAAVTEADWFKVKAVLAPYAAYLASKKGGIVENIPVDKLEAWKKGDFAERAAKLQEEDAVVAKRVAAFNDLEKLVLYHRRLPRFLNNYVSLTELYNPRATALFERGRLLIDGRWFNLAIEVDDPGAHSAVAKNGELFTMYVKVEPHGGGTPFIVVVPATSGTRGNLQVGKRGVFFDLENHEYDAAIVSIIENPISLKEAILAPFKNIGKAIMGKIEGMAGDSQSKFEAQAGGAALDAMDGKAPEAPAPAQPPAGGGMGGGMFMTISIAIAALGSAFAFLAQAVSSMSVQARITTLVVLLAIIFGPIILAGVLKLMRQDLGPTIEGCGWAVNKSMRLTRRLRRQFTLRLPYPKGAKGTPCRHFAASVFKLIVIIALIWAAWWSIDRATTTWCSDSACETQTK